MGVRERKDKYWRGDLETQGSHSEGGGMTRGMTTLIGLVFTKINFYISFLNLKIKGGEGRGVPKNQWLSLEQAKGNLNNSDLSTVLVGLYTSIRTHFSQNQGN